MDVSDCRHQVSTSYIHLSLDRVAAHYTLHGMYMNLMYGERYKGYIYSI